MANKHPDDYVFGLDKDVQEKMKLKFDGSKLDECQVWLEGLTGKKFPASFHDSLKDGVLLCEAINVIKAGSVPKINTGAMVFKQRENIVNFLEACKKLGMKDSDCFVTKDLFEGDNLMLVADTLMVLGGLAKKLPGYSGPSFGLKLADENKRTFTEEQIVAGKTINPMQSSGSIAVEKSKGTDAIVMYGKVGQEMGKASSEATQQNAGSIAVDKGAGTDHIVRYGKVGQEMGKASSEITQQNAGSIAVDKGAGTDHIVRYGKVGQDMGNASSEPGMQNMGAIHVEKNRNLDSINRDLTANPSK